MKYIRENWSGMLSVLFLIVVGVLLLYNPSFFAVAIIRIAGILFLLLGIWDVIKYFRMKPEEAAKGSGFYSGMLMVTVGLFSIFGENWFVRVFPVLAVVYGLMQILLGYRVLQQMMDALRVKNPVWKMRAISAGLSILFGFVIIFNPGMTMINIWVFTGVTMIIEGVLDAVALVVLARKKKKE